ncbi:MULTISPECIES: hypothetical protein [Flavobacterium]|jgi:hypothetical protein|uniref:Uncharacterized protein n=1 Tax=Flavobacterium quisquiliarum TaxID=1834436 RepID=A0ABV8WGC4_9FLAO|nr:MULTISPECIES: hypothetical protein [Flavobacterium]MBW1656728.1 hypothetical protein [Flavobacterium quisquiliarum]NWL00353.1 hypothetical protein [Flavobacterium collinsii]WET04117.1 hypothetical protein P0R33_07180 [Flavobacterium sp. YJ01]
MDANRVMVYDKFHYFSRFLKYEFKDINFVAGHKADILYGHEMTDDLSLVVFVFYSENDLIDLLRINSYGIPVLVCNHCPQFLNKFKNIQNIEVLECLDTKRGFRNDLRLHFEEKFSLVDEQSICK